MPDINLLVDNRNQKLWEDVNSHFTIKLQPSSNDEYSCYSINSSITLFVPLDNLCPDSFTHELLHIFLRSKDIYIGPNFKLTMLSSKVLASIFSEPLLEHIGNCLDHVKMLPIYLQLGFERKKFILDYDTPKCSDSEINIINKNYNTKRAYSRQAIDLYIGKYIGMKADANDEIDYTRYLGKLKSIDTVLYSALEKFVNSWEKFDIEDNGPLNSYREIVSDFYTDLKPWMTNKTFH